MSIADIRQGLADALAALPGLRVAAYYPDQFNPPMGVVDSYRIDWDSAFGRGSDSITFSVLLAVHRQSERTAQEELDSWVPLVKAAIESDRTLGGASDSLRVTTVSEARALDNGEASYLAAAFAVQVIATA